MSCGRFAAAVAASCALAACGGKSGTGAPSGGPRSHVTSPSPAASVTLGADVHPVSLAAVRRGMAQLYRSHPSLAGFTVQDVSYTARSRARVLGACAGTSRTPSAQVETSRVLACAPLVFYYYEYGTRSAAPQSTRLAEAIYSYAVSTIRGPLSARAVLSGILHSWGLPVAAAPARSGPSTNPAVTALLGSVRRAMLERSSVRVQITGYRSGERRPAERITADVSTDSGSERLRAGGATASIRVTPAAAYLSGNPSGLEKLLGISAARARQANGRWLKAARGSSEFQNLQAEDTLPALPASILPAAGELVGLSAGSTAERTLTWASTTSGGTRIRVVLRVSGGTDPLPISETTTAGAYHETVRFSRWNEPLKLAAPK